MQLSDSRKSVEEKCQSSSSRHTRTGIIIAIPFTVRKLQPMGSRDKPYVTPKTFTKEIGKREIYAKLTATGRTSPRVPNAKTATRESRCCLPPLESMFANSSSSSSGTKVRDSSENFHILIYLVLFQIQRQKKISWTQKTWISRGSKQQQDQQVSSQVWQGLGFRVLEWQQSIVHLQLKLYMELWSLWKSYELQHGFSTS